jgi:Skp family chaperone for outer membrane proteins
MRKFVIILGLILLTSPAFAGGVGYINYEKVAANYNFARTSMKEIEAKGREIENYLKAKEIEFSKLETPLQKQKFQETVQAEMKTKEKAFNDFRNKREEQVYQRIYAVSEKIRLEKELDVLIDARGVFSGGVDITDTVIQRLNANGGMK